MASVEELTAEHRTLEGLADALLKLAQENSRNLESAANVFFRAMYQHMAIEERGPFVSLRAAAPGLVTDLLSDHRRLYHELGIQLRKAYDAGDHGMVTSIVHNLVMTLKAHHRREERLLFPELIKTAAR
jgi:hemerythrin superfamily protein